MNKHVLRVSILVGFLVTSPAFAEPTGRLEGTLRYLGEVPPAKKILTSDGTIVWEKRIAADSKTKGLRYVVVGLEGVPAKPAKKAEPAYVDQQEMTFLPRVVAIQQGQAVRFDNSDSCNHSVMAISKEPKNRFNVFVAQGKPHDHVFALQQKPVIIGCSLHAWMRAWVFVHPHPWFAVTDSNGKFAIDGIPPGKYKVRLRHADTGFDERHTVVIRPGKTTRLDLDWKSLKK